jgi:hypothetical protein
MATRNATDRDRAVQEAIAELAHEQTEHRDWLKARVQTLLIRGALVVGLFFVCNLLGSVPVGETQHDLGPTVPVALFVVGSIVILGWDGILGGK